MQDAIEALHLVRQMDSLSGQSFAEIALSDVRSCFGEFGQALTHAHEALRIATAIEHQQWMAVTSYALGDTYLHLLQPAMARAALESGLELSRSLGSAFLIGVLTALQGLAYVLRTRPVSGAATLTAVMLCEQSPSTLAERQIAWVWGELALAQGEPSRALQRAEQLLASAPGEERTQPIPHLLKLKGEALMALSRFEEAVQAFEEAKRGAQMRHDRSILWPIQRSCGQLYRRLKREEHAQREYGAARQVIEELAATIDETALREDFLQTALFNLFHARETAYLTGDGKHVYGGLPLVNVKWRRSLQGAYQWGDCHPAGGERTDGRIPCEQYSGEVRLHSRAQIAAWAVEKGLSLYPISPYWLASHLKKNTYSFPCISVLSTTARERFPAKLRAVRGNARTSEKQVTTRRSKKQWEQHRYRANSGEYKSRIGLTCKKRSASLSTKSCSIEPMLAVGRGCWISVVEQGWRHSLPPNSAHMSPALMHLLPQLQLHANGCPTEISALENSRNFLTRMPPLMWSPGLMPFNMRRNPVVALQEARRVVKTGGQVAMVTWGRAEDCEHAVTLAAVMALLPPPPPGAEGPFALSEPGRMEALLEQAGLTPSGSGDIDVPMEYPDAETAWRGMSSSGPLVRAIRYAGEAAVKQAIFDSLEPYKTANGGYRQENTFRYAIATA